MTAMRLSQDNNETQGVNRNRPTEMGQHSTNTRSYQPTNGVMPSGHDRAKASSSNAGLSVQVSIYFINQNSSVSNLVNIGLCNRT